MEKKLTLQSATAVLCLVAETIIRAAAQLKAATTVAALSIA